MNIEIKAVHFDLTDSIKEHIQRKMHKIDFAKNLIIDLLFTLTKEKKRYKIESNINFKFGKSTHISVKDFELPVGIEKLFDKIDQKVSKEKDKIKDHT